MRKPLKYGILIVLSLCGFWLVRLLFMRPFQIDHFFDRTFLLYALDSPEYLSTSRLLDQYGITSHRQHLDDISVHSLDRVARFFKQTEETFQGYDRADLDEEQALSYDIFQWYLQSLQGEVGRWRFHNYPLNQMNGVQNDFPVFMQDVHVVTSKAEAHDYVSRLYAVQQKFEQLMEGLKIRQGKGIVPPDFILDRLLENMRAFIAVPPLENILYQSFEAKLLESRMDDKERDVYRKGAEAAMRDAVYPAYTKLIATTEQLRASATSDAGVWKWPDGEAYYRHILREHTTLDLEPEAVHQLGLKEVSRIQAELRDLLQKQGLMQGMSLNSALKKLDEDPRFYYADDEAGRSQALRDYQAIIDEAAGSFGAYFQTMPKASVTVERPPAFMEATAPTGSYQGPALDGTRGGIFYANLANIRSTIKYGMRTLAYHETIPGHHLQVAWAQEMKDLPMFRREVHFTAYVEGWALYAERLAFEAGLGLDAFDSIGRLRAELYRAARLVVDTGLHAKRWTRQQALDFLQNEAHMIEAQANREVDRYVVAPGQACAYMIGMLKFLELRTKAQTALGARFDIKAFHQLILENGAMPLTLLERRVERWITQQP